MKSMQRVNELMRADARSIPLADGTVQCIVTSPPYWGLRDYGLNGHGLGLEPTLDAYIENMRAVGRELWRVLRDDGTFWLNLGDAYAGSGGAHTNGTNPGISKSFYRDGAARTPNSQKQRTNTGSMVASETEVPSGLKPKDLVGLPWRVAFALQADGWYLRSDIIWAKPNPMPESVTDRPTKSHEYLFLMSKRPRYFYDAEAVRESSNGTWNSADDWRGREELTAPELDKGADRVMQRTRGFGTHHPDEERTGRNRRTVWVIPTAPFAGAHFATFPPKLVEPCILAGTSPKCCGACGAPWERVVERGPESYTTTRGRQAWAAETGQRDSYGGLPQRATSTLGWRPACDHDDDTGSCLVLDPFAGSGTVGAVSRRFGRRFVGLDLSAPYLKLAQERIGAETLGMAL